MKIKNIKKDPGPILKVPKKHKGIKCKVVSCGVWSFYVKDKCWLCNTPFGDVE